MVSPQLLFQINRGNEEKKRKLFNDLANEIEFVKKIYKKDINSREIDNTALNVYEDALITFKFPEQNFELYFRSKLIAEVKKMVNVKPAQEEILISDTSSKEVEPINDCNQNDSPTIEEVDQSIVITEGMEVSDSYRMFVKEALSYPILSHEEITELFKKYRAGSNEAKELIICSNLRLVIYCVKKFRGRGMEFIDLIQEGNMYLIKAVEKYDYETGNKFSGYAYNGISLGVHRAIQNKGRIVRVSCGVLDRYNIFRKKLDKLIEQYGRQLTNDEIMENLKISAQSLETYRKIEMMPISYDQPSIYAEDDTPLIDTYVSDQLSFEDDVIDNIMKEGILKVINNSNLSNRQKDIILLRYGFINDRIYKLEEIAKMYGVSRQRIGILEIQALEKLRKLPEFSHPDEVKKGITYTKY